MISLSKKNSIINSYARTISEIILLNNNIEEFKKVKQFVDNFDTEKLNISPVLSIEYNKKIKNILTNIDKDSLFQKAIFYLLDRKYGFLLKDIFDATYKKLQKVNRNKQISVLSRNEINENEKKNICNLIKKQLGENVDVDFKTKNNIESDSIEFIANNNICTINIKNLLIKELLK